MSQASPNMPLIALASKRGRKNGLYTERNGTPYAKQSSGSWVISSISVSDINDRANYKYAALSSNSARIIHLPPLPKLKEYLSFFISNNWDGADALAITAKQIDDVRSFLDSSPIHIPLPELAVSRRGQIDLLYEHGKHYISLSFCSDGYCELYVDSPLTGEFGKYIKSENLWEDKKVQAAFLDMNRWQSSQPYLIATKA